MAPMHSPVHQNFTRAVSGLLDPFQVEDNDAKERQVLAHYSYNLQRVGAVFAGERYPCASNSRQASDILSQLPTMLQQAIQSAQLRQLRATSIPERAFHRQRELALLELANVKCQIQNLLVQRNQCQDLFQAQQLGQNITCLSQRASNIISDLNNSN